LENKKLKLDELNRVDVDTFKHQDKFNIYLVLDNIRSLNNVGTFFRTGDAFNVMKIFLCGITGCPPHRDIHKTALGATESVDWEYAEEALALVERLQSEGIEVCAIEQTSETVFLQNLNWSSEKPIALVFGNEVEGVQQAVIDASKRVIEIPHYGTKHTLNVSEATGNVLWECVRGLVK
jgi:tRNA G18 (ribose-2'-O)-methylase SpoU